MPRFEEILGVREGYFTVLKTVEVQASGGSNPPPSAIVMCQDIGTS